MQFAVGLKLKSKAEHVMVDAEDALIAALKVKAERPEALIMYVRRQNRRGDARKPPPAGGTPSPIIGSLYRYKKVSAHPLPSGVDYDLRRR